ncbi:MAG: hypothetical protein GY820_05410 [Gammaproteobacteria bacterium]|nr:hypothetical protein [Gammaproteobacteria bacterium]
MTRLGPQARQTFFISIFTNFFVEKLKRSPVAARKVAITRAILCCHTRRQGGVVSCCHTRRQGGVASSSRTRRHGGVDPYGVECERVEPLASSFEQRKRGTVCFRCRESNAAV